MDPVAMGPGVLRQEAAATRFTLARHEPPADLAPFVDFCWVVRWDLTGQPPYEQSILPHPNVNLAFETTPAPRAAVYGVDTKIFTRRLSGAGKALGIRFRPGGFRPFHTAPIFTLNDTVVPATAIFGPGAEPALAGVMSAADDAAMIACAASLLRAAHPRPDPLTDEVAGIAGLITTDPSLRRVAELVTACGIPERRLQRLFAEYVGVSPKWVMRRARLHEAAQRVDAGEVIDWATLATDLGYADQAHLTRDFTATLGVPPSRYAAGSERR
jgi:AraC-like DNA-binding protein